MPYYDHKSLLLVGTRNMFTHLVGSFISSKLMMNYEICSLSQAMSSSIPDSCPLHLIILQDYQDAEIQGYLHHLQKHQPDTKVAIVCFDEERDTTGYVNWPIIKGIFHCKQADTLLQQGINEINRGGFWFSRQQLEMLAHNRVAPKPALAMEFQLTNREEQIINLLAKGLSNRDIAESLFLSPHTVKTHLYNLYKKVGVKSRLQAVHWAKNHMDQTA